MSPVLSSRAKEIMNKAVRSVTYSVRYLETHGNSLDILVPGLRMFTKERAEVDKFTSLLRNRMQHVVRCCS